MPLPLSFIVTAALSLATHRQQPNTRPFDRVIGVDLRGATIADALATIADSAHITIDYNRTDVGAVAQHVTYLASRVTVGTALEHVLGNRFVAHEAGINQVIVTRADTVVTVSGVVSDSASHQPIASVNVLLNGSKIGTVTGADGAFRLRIPNADTTLLFFRIGYQRHEVRVRDGTTVLNVRLGQTPQSLSAVQVTASTNQQPVEHTPDIAVVQEIKMAPSVVS
ncbi:MAG TPA: carboxypeptidase-like regulatory domain-containing protein, partial [Gemmatimonadaceae bacterium]|nr:carboxypeptidase-like regulatory domain-containing protein [Gemmatimonadaceae bacterium]